MKLNLNETEATQKVNSTPLKRRNRWTTERTPNCDWRKGYVTWADLRDSKVTIRLSTFRISLDWKFIFIFYYILFVNNGFDIGCKKDLIMHSCSINVFVQKWIKKNKQLLHSCKFVIRDFTPKNCNWQQCNVKNLNIKNKNFRLLKILL